MKRKLLDYLSCPTCAGAISLASIGDTDDQEIMEGELTCSSCAKTFPIRRGIPRFASAATLEADKAATAENFGWQWQHFTQDDDRYGEQFLGWIASVQPNFFRGKIVLEGGCGKGRHASGFKLGSPRGHRRGLERCS